MDARSKLWMIILPLAVAIFIGLGCNMPGSIVNDRSKLPTRLPIAMVSTGTPQPYIEVTPPARSQQKIILMSALPDNKSNLNEVVFMIPEELAQAEIYANDVKVEGSPREDRVVQVDLKGKVDADIVTFSFRNGLEQRALCVIYVEDLLKPQGDCIW